MGRLRFFGMMFVVLAEGCSRRAPPVFHHAPADFRIKGTYYSQPKAAINNFWAWVDFEQAKSDFRRLEEDGFNTIVLSIPWGFFQSNIRPITYNEIAFEELKQLLTMANSYGFNVILRVGSHEYVPKGAGGVHWAAATVLTNDEEWDAYRDLFREMAARTRAYPNLLAVFWTFEDAGYTPDLWLHSYPTNAAAFRRWLQRKPLASWNEFWGESNVSYDTIQPPDRASGPQNKLFSFVQFADELVAGRMPDVCAAIREGNWELPVSFQPRAEINWGYDYSRQFQLPSCYTFVTTWFSPYQSYLFGDTQPDLNGRRVATHVPDYIERTRRLSNGLPIFIDQFNFRHFGGPKGESALGSEKDELEFISNGLPNLLQSTLGYTLWNYNDYYLNVTYNGSFRFGLDDWEVSPEPGGVRVLDAGGQRHWVEIQPGGWIRQEQISAESGQEYTIEFDAEAQSSGEILSLEVDFPGTHQHTAHSFPLVEQRTSFQWKMKIPPYEDKMNIAFRSARSSRPVRIGNILLYPWIDTGGIYTVDGQPRSQLRDLFRHINRFKH